jgi:NAD(P) transhydrogenase
MKHFDLCVIGTGPGGQKAAIQGTKLGKRVCIIEKNNVLGGASINTGTIPSKALREAVLHLTGVGRRGLFGEVARLKRNITIADLVYISQQVINKELSIIRDQLDRNGVELIWGTARFDEESIVFVDRADDFEALSADFFVIATGSRPAKPDTIPFDDKTVFTSDELLNLHDLPKSMIVVGGGVIGTEYACMVSTLGVKTTLVEGRNEVLGFLDREITESFHYQMRRAGITLRLGEKVAKIERLTPEQSAAKGDPAVPLVQATLESGKQLRAQTLLYAVGRQGTTEAMHLDKAGMADGRSPSPARQRRLPDERASHLRRRRRDRLSGAGLHINGARPPGGLPCVRRAHQQHPRAFPLRHLRHPGNLHGGKNRGPAHRRRHPV